MSALFVGYAGLMGGFSDRNGSNVFTLSCWVVSMTKAAQVEVRERERETLPRV